MLAEAALILGTKNGIRARAMDAQTASLVALQGDLVGHAAPGDFPAHYAAGRFRIRVTVHHAITIRSSRTFAIRTGQEGVEDCQGVWCLRRHECLNSGAHGMDEK